LVRYPVGRGVRIAVVPGEARFAGIMDGKSVEKMEALALHAGKTFHIPDFSRIGDGVKITDDNRRRVFEPDLGDELSKIYNLRLPNKAVIKEIV
jgi:hypothetical protein